MVKPLPFPYQGQVVSRRKDDEQVTKRKEAPMRAFAMDGNGGGEQIW